MKRSTRIKRRRQKIAEELNVATMREFIARQAAIINDPAQRRNVLATLDDKRFQ